MKISKIAVSVAALVFGSGTICSADVVPWVCKNDIPDFTWVYLPIDTAFPIGGQAGTSVDFLPNDGQWQLVEGYAAAFANCFYENNLGVNAYRTITGGDFDLAFPPTGDAYAYSVCGAYPVGSWYSRPGTYSSAGVARVLAQQDAAVPEIASCTQSGVSAYNIDTWDEEGPIYPGGASAATARAYGKYKYVGTGTPYAVLSVRLLVMFDPVGITRNVGTIGGAGVSAVPGVIGSQHGSRATPGMSNTSGVWTYQATAPMTTGVETEFNLVPLVFNDNGMDVDGSGRFNQDDVDALIAHIGTSDTSIIALYDFSGDDAIDAEDVVILADIVAAGFDSGYFGDTNQDGVVDCLDRSGLTLEGYTLDDVEYVITMDYDLDGLIDASDIAAADAWIPTADIDRNGGIDGADLGAFFDLFDVGDLAVDFDHNGGVDGGDLAVFFDMFDDGC